MKSKWKVMSQVIPGVGKVYRAYRLLDTSRPTESGNIEGYGEYSEDRDAVQETVDRLNALEEQNARQDSLKLCKCPVCGREFLPTAEWHWTESGIKFCRYNCYLKRGAILEAERKKARSYRSKGRVRKLRSDGAEVAVYEDIDAAAKAEGIPKNVIRAACASGIADPMGNCWEYEKKEEDEA